MLSNLVSIADALDSSGFHTEADTVDRFICVIGRGPMPQNPIPQNPPASDPFQAVPQVGVKMLQELQKMVNRVVTESGKKMQMKDLQPILNAIKNVLKTLDPNTKP